MTKEEAIKALKYERKTALHENKSAFDMAIKALSQECVGSTQKHVGNALEMRCDDAVSREDEMTFNNLCDSCTNIGCEFQYGIVRTKCAFYMPPHVAKECYEDLCRYFGGAKDILKNREDFKAWLDRIKWHIHKAEELSEENDDLRDQLAMRDRFQKQEPCDDVISRKDIQDYIAKYLSQYLYEDVRQAVEAIDTYIGDMPSVTQKPDKYRKEARRWKNKWLKARKSGHWIEENHDEYELWICSECGAYTELDMSEEYGCGWKFCPMCGAKMVKPQETETWNGIHAQITAPKGTFDRIFNGADDDNDI